VHRRLSGLIAANGPIAVTEPVIMEVVAGARDDHSELRLRRLMLRFALMGFDTATDFDGAVRIYRNCRAAGVTPRRLIDCMIAAVALRYSASLLTKDADLRRIARVMDIELEVA
jgi:predicted nucleic acid-binding protein